jgi:hypothetical protein
MGASPEASAFCTPWASWEQAECHQKSHLTMSGCLWLATGTQKRSLRCIPCQVADPRGVADPRDMSDHAGSYPENWQQLAALILSRGVSSSRGAPVRVSLAPADNLFVLLLTFFFFGSTEV